MALFEPRPIPYGNPVVHHRPSQARRPNGSRVTGDARVAEAIAAFENPVEQGTSKLTSLADAIRRHVEPSMALHLCWSDARPNAALLEIVRQFAGTKPGFTLSSVGIANSQVAIIAAGLVSRLVTAYAGESYPAGAPNPLMQRALSSSAVAIENWSQWTIVARLMAGALGLPFMPTQSLRGSSMADEHMGRDFGTVRSPFGAGEDVPVVAALTPDLALLQGVAADAWGNVVMAAPYGELHWGALAAQRGVIACVEHVVSTAEIRRHPGLVKVPGHAVLAVCHVPFGSHPYGSFNPGLSGLNQYSEDSTFIAECARACRTDAAFDAWLQEWVHGPGSHEGYLAKLGDARLRALREAAEPSHWRKRAEPGWLRPPEGGGWTREEAMIVASARRIAARVRVAGHRTVLAGIGASSLAAWLADDLLRAEGVEAPLLSEIGIYGYAPQPGEPFVFSKANTGTARMLTDVTATLGAMVAGSQGRCLGAIGAALLGRNGDIGSTYDEDGGFIVGSGGANDIASTASEVLVTIRHDKKRLLEKVGYVTSPGHAVRTVVTTRGVLERRAADEPFRLVSVLGRAGEQLEDAVAAAVDGCGWTLDVDPGVCLELDPSAEELDRLRMLDPQRVFLRGRAAVAANK